MKKYLALLLLVLALPATAQINTIFATAAATQTSAGFDGTCKQALWIESLNSGVALSAGTLTVQASLDGNVWSNTALTYTYSELNSGAVKSLTTCAPFARVVLASFAFTYGKTQTTGTGLSDLTMGGAYTPLVNHTYYIKISTAAGTDKFQWKKDTGSYSAEIAITTLAQTVADGVTVTFAASTGHVLGDIWTITTPSVVVLEFAR